MTHDYKSALEIVKFQSQQYMMNHGQHYVDTLISALELADRMQSGRAIIDTREMSVKEKLAYATTNRSEGGDKTDWRSTRPPRQNARG